MDDVKGKRRRIHSASRRGGWGWEERQNVLKALQGVGDPATTFGIALLSVDVCYGDVVSSLLRCGSGLGSGSKFCHAFPFFQNNNNINICLKPQTHSMNV